jgi:hypothetical protein
MFTISIISLVIALTIWFIKTLKLSTLKIIIISYVVNVLFWIVIYYLLPYETTYIYITAYSIGAILLAIFSKQYVKLLTYIIIKYNK